MTSVGLEVEKMDAFEEVKGNLQGLIIGEVLQVDPHPNADKLRLTKVDIGGSEPLQIVCGAPNVAPGQRVVVATIGTTIYPHSGDPLTMKLAKIRGVESHGMICAEDEIGLGSSHEGIMVLKEDAKPGTSATDYFQPYKDIIYEIGLTPNRMDAMSHWGVARDICAYLTHHDKKEIRAVLPSSFFKADNQSLKIEVSLENEEACQRYSGVCLSNIKVGPSPKWLQQRLKAIGLRPINNIVDVTNYIQHETGQPLHAFDYNAIRGQRIIVKTEAEGTLFITLDEKERKLDKEDLMICNAEEGMCIAGVFGGSKSGVTDTTTGIFLESAWFDPVSIRKTSFRHHLRTDAATRFEKGVDISNTVNVLKRAALLIKEIAGGAIASEIVDIYPDPKPKKQIIFKYQFLKKLSGKSYHPDAVKHILQSLGFGVLREDIDAIWVEVPHHKHDISLPADLVEEIVRIDGLDNIPIPGAITITPSVEEHAKSESLKEKISGFLAGCGFNEILTNSITNSKYFTEPELEHTVKLLNNLSVELDVMRPAMLPTALEVIAFNINRKNNNLKLFEFGKTYRSEVLGQYEENNHLCIYITGNLTDNHWKVKVAAADLFYLKGIAEAVLRLTGLQLPFTQSGPGEYLDVSIAASLNDSKIVEIGKVAAGLLARFDIKQPVFFARFNWDALCEEVLKHKISYAEIAKFPSVERDLALVVPREMKYEQINQQLQQLRISKLQEIRLFDVFESAKLGLGKKSLAINFTFLDEEKTLTDKEIDGWMGRIMNTLEKELGAEIRK